MLAVAVRLLADGGYAGMTLAQVANEAGYSDRLAQYYFETKLGLLSAVIDEVGAQRKTIDVLEADTGRAAVDQWVDNNFRFMLKTPEHCRALHVIIVESVITVPELQDDVRRMGRGGLSVVRSALTRGIKDGTVDAATDVGVAALAIIALVRTTHDDWFFNPGIDLKARRAAVESLTDSLTKPRRRPAAPRRR